MERLFFEKKRVNRDVFSHDQRCGFTLIELIIAMAIGLLILGASYRVFEAQNKILKNQEQIVELQQNVRAAMDMLTREVRMAGYNPASVAFTSVVVGSSQLKIKADLDGNAGIAGQEYIIYAFDSTNVRITRNIGAGTQPFAENIEAFTCQSLLDANGNVALVSITIRGRTALPDPSYSANGGYRTYELTSAVKLRNFALLNEGTGDDDDEGDDHEGDDHEGDDHEGDDHEGDDHEGDDHEGDDHEGDDHEGDDHEGDDHEGDDHEGDDHEGDDHEGDDHEGDDHEGDDHEGDDHEGDDHEEDD